MIQPTAHEMLHINELIRLEASDTQKIQSMLPMIGNPELRQLFQECVQTGQAHTRAMVDYCKTHQLGH